MQQEAGADAVFQAWIRQAVRERTNLVVRAHDPGTLEVRPAHVAGASASKAILRELAALYGARLQLLHVMQNEPDPAFYTRQLRLLYEAVPGPQVDADVYALPGHAPEAIAAFAGDHGSDLIVISTHGLTGFRHLLLVSVTLQVVRAALCPVFTVRAYGKSLVMAALHNFRQPDFLRAGGGSFRPRSVSAARAKELALSLN